MDIASLANFALASLPAKWAALALALFGFCSAIIAVWPPPKNLRTVPGFIWQGIDWVALNFGHGKTAAKAVAEGKMMRVPTDSIVLGRSRLGNGG